MLGETIKGYRIIQSLGQGGFGEVWAAEQPIVHTRVAIKLLHAHISTNRDHVRRFFSEAIAVSKIKHAGIVKIFDVGFHDGRAFLIMDLLEGETLSARIARAGRLPAGDAAELARQIASVLEATHAEGIVHRDLKPDNVFLVPDHELASKERVKILDFGFAKLDLGLTRSSETMGTPAYIAPEQWGQASAVDGRADVYSLGCIVFQACCGRLPFDAETIHQWYAQHRETPPLRARSVVPELPAELDELIARMLAKSPAERPSARELVAAFARIAERDLGSTLGNAVGALDEQRRSSRRRGRGLAAIGAGVGIGAVVGAVAFFATRGGPQAPADAPLVGIDAPSAPSAPPDAPSAPVDAPDPPRPDPSPNPWVRIDPPATPYLLGLPDTAPAAHVGLRASRDVVTPSRPYEIQEHEVMWSELEPWLAARGERVAYPPWAADARARARLPATNITWSMAAEYCRSLGGELPTEEQWEYAARGPERRANPWGAEPLDRQRTHTYAGPKAVPRPVMTSPQDRTPGPGRPIWDLTGNVQEWTLGLWREPRAGMSETDVQVGQSTARAIRGLPLSDPPPAAVHPDTAAFRTRMCATGRCVEKTRRILAYVGFRCARPLER